MVKLTLEAWRVNAGLTQKEASKLLEISNTTLCNWETGKSHPSSKKIDLICEIYGCHYDNINFLPNNSLKAKKHKRRKGNENQKLAHR